MPDNQTYTNGVSEEPSGVAIPVNSIKQQEKEEIKMADVDTQMLSSQHADIRREVAMNAADIRKEGVENTAAVRRDVMFEGQENVNATKDARHDILSLTIPTIEAAADRLSAQTNTEADRIVDRISEGRVETADRFFTVGRDTADLRAQVIQAIDTTKLATELNALKGIIEGQKNTQYLADRIGMEGDRTRALINDLKYHDLNRGLIERNAALVEADHDRRHWRHHAEQAQYQGQWAQLQSQIQAFQSQLQETRQGMVNFGTMAGVGQSSTSNNVR